MPAPIPTPEQAIARTRAWVRRAVIGLNLCPFAKAVDAKDRIRYVASDATGPEALLETLCDEMKRLAEADPEEIETTLLIHPQALLDFLDYNDFLDLAEAVLEQMGYGGLLQIASFHPQYQFAGTEPDDIGNASNRSPYPSLHLLREESVERAVAAFPEAEAIFEANIATMRRLGESGWARLQQQCRDDADGSALA